MAAARHLAPDGRAFTVALGACLCDPCWQARCACDAALTKHAFDAASAEREALEVLASADPRPGFGHARCAA